MGEKAKETAEQDPIGSKPGSDEGTPEGGAPPEDRSKTEDTSDKGTEEDHTEFAQLMLEDPNKLPAPLKAHFKRIQAAYTRDRQSRAVDKKKAAALDELMLIPDFRQWLDNRFGAPPKDEDTSTKKASKRKATKDEDDDDESDASDSALSKFEEIIDRKLSPIINERLSDRKKAEQAKIQEEAEKFKKDNPHWENYKEEMKEVWAIYPNLTYEDCLFIAQKRDVRGLLDKYVPKPEKNGKARSSNIGKPSGEEMKEMPSQRAKSFEEAAAQAMKQLGIK